MCLMATVLDIAVLYYVCFLLLLVFVYFLFLFFTITTIPWDENNDLVKFGKTL